MSPTLSVYYVELSFITILLTLNIIYVDISLDNNITRMLCVSQSDSSALVTSKMKPKKKNKVTMGSP